MKNVVTRLGNLAKIQANVTSRNILTTSFNINEFHDQHAGLSPQNPQVSTPAVDQPAYQVGSKISTTSLEASLLEAAFGFNRYDLNQISRGLDPYFISPETAGGNYYLTAHTRADRWQASYSTLRTEGRASSLRTPSSIPRPEFLISGWPTTRPEASYLLHINQWRILVGRVRFARCTATPPIGIVKDSLISSECGALDSRSNKPTAGCRHVEAGQRTGNRSEGGPRARLL